MIVKIQKAILIFTYRQITSDKHNNQQIIICYELPSLQFPNWRIKEKQLFRLLNMCVCLRQLQQWSLINNSFSSLIFYHISEYFLLFEWHIFEGIFIFIIRIASRFILIWEYCYFSFSIYRSCTWTTEGRTLNWNYLR